MTRFSAVTRFLSLHATGLHIVLFKFTWLLLVFFQSQGMLWAFVLQLPCVLMLPAIVRRLFPVLLLTLAGITADYLLIACDLLRFPDSGFPAWLAMLWFAFALLLLRLTPWLRQIHWPALLVSGALLGPLSYWLGALAGAVQLHDRQVFSLVGLMLVWGVFLPLAVALLSRYRQSAPDPLLFCLLLAGSLGSQQGLAEQQLIGEAELKVFFRRIYDASLYAGSPDFRFSPGEDFSLRLTYQLDLESDTIVRETFRQWQYQGLAVKPEWQDFISKTIPDVRKGDQLTLSVQDGSGSFLHNNELLAETSDPAFLRAFAGIWLAPETAYPELRKQLLGFP